MEVPQMRVTTDNVPDADVVVVLDIVRGNTFEAKSTGRNFTQRIRNVFRGQLKACLGLFAEVREEATVRMERDAEEMVLM